MKSLERRAIRELPQLLVFDRYLARLYEDFGVDLAVGPLVRVSVEREHPFRTS